jgi:hypothetical protein
MMVNTCACEARYDFLHALQWKLAQWLGAGYGAHLVGSWQRAPQPQVVAEGHLVVECLQGVKPSSDGSLLQAHMDELVRALELRVAMQALCRS